MTNLLHARHLRIEGDLFCKKKNHFVHPICIFCSHCKQDLLLDKSLSSCIHFIFYLPRFFDNYTTIIKNIFLLYQIWQKENLVLGLFLNITINLACSFSTNLMMFIILKAACGFFAAGSLMTMVVYCTECISEKKRTLGSMILRTFYSLGGVVLALPSYSTQNWRKLALFTSTPYISVLLISL